MLVILSRQTQRCFAIVEEIRFCVISLAKKSAFSMIIRIFAVSVLAKPLNEAQIVRGVFVFMGIWQQGFRL